MNNKSGKDMANNLADFFNGAGPKDIEEFSNQLVHNTHRTLQQAVMRGVVSMINRYAGLTSSQYDLRNEATVRLAKAIKNDVDPNLLLLPFI